MKKSRSLTTVAVAAVVTTLVVAAQVSAHYQTPNTNTKLKHDLKHLDGYVTNLVGNSFVDGNARVLRARQTITETVNTEKPMLTVPGMGPIKLVKQTAFSDCNVTWTNQTGQVITRNGLGRIGTSSTVFASPTSTDARLDPGQIMGFTTTDGQLQSGVGMYHISTVDLRKVMIVDVALNQGIPPGAATDCAATVVVTYTTI